VGTSVGSWGSNLRPLLNERIPISMFVLNNSGSVNALRALQHNDRKNLLGIFLPDTKGGHCLVAKVT
jgi:hypothetical protein